MRPMSTLRRTLYAMAAVWAACAVALVAVPRWALVDLFGQPVYPDYAYVRVAGVCSFCLAMLMVITAQRLEEMWVFTWAFVFAAAGTFVVALANAVWGHPAGGGTTLWWLFAGFSLAFAAGLLVGIARAGEERPPI
jgi:hypothetical protein